MTENKTNESKKMNPLLTIVFAVILPILVATILAVIVLSFIGVDVVGWTESKLAKAPVVSSFVKTENEKSLIEKLDKANHTIDTQDELIDELENKIEQLEAQLANLEIDLVKVENQTNPDDLGTSQLEEDADIKKLASSFRKMDKEQAAKIVNNLNESNAVLLLMNISGEVRGEILEAMDPQVAANLMERMME